MTKVEGGRLKSLLSSIEKFENVELIKDMFNSIVPLHSGTIPLLVIQCEKYGWKTFGAAIVKMFGKHCRKSAIENLNSLIVYSGQKIIFQNIFQQILDKADSKSCDSIASCNFCRYGTTEEDKIQFEHEIWQLLVLVTEKVDFNLLDYVKSKSFKDFVPVLLKLSPKASIKFNTFWMIIANHFVTEMENESKKSLTKHIWQRMSVLICSCDYCSTLNDFLRSNEEDKYLLIEQGRLIHILEQIKSMKNVHFHQHPSEPNTLKVWKVAGKAFVNQFRSIELSRQLLSKLKSMMALNC